MHTVELLKAEAVAQIQTDLQAAVAASASAAAGSATASANSANAAASSAVQAAQAIAGLFINGVAGNAVPAVPVPVSGPALAGHHYRITSVGTSQGKTWAIGDAAIYNGTSGSWTQLTGFFSGATAYTDDLVRQRQGVDQIVSDGASTGRAQYQHGSSRTAVAGAPVVTGRWWIPPMAANPPASAYLGAIYGALTGEPAGVSNSLSVFVASSGELRVVAKGANQATDFRQFGRANFRSTYLATSGGVLEVTVAMGTANPVMRWNSVDISNEFGSATGGAVPDWLSPTLGTAHLVSGFAWPAGPVPIGCWILGALTDADRTFWRTTGKPPAWVAVGGAAQNVPPTYADGGAAIVVGADTVNLVGASASVVSSTDYARPGRTTSYKVTSTGAGGLIWLNVVPGLFTPNALSRWGINDVDSYVYIPSGQAGNAGDLANWGNLSTGSSASPTALGTLSNEALAFDTWVKTSRVGVVPGTGSASVITGLGVVPAGGVFYVGGLKVTVRGALSLSLVQAGRVVGDATTIGDNPARLVGMTQITDRKDWQFTINSATNGNEQLLGGEVLDTTRDVLDFVEQEPVTGTPTTAIGSASGGAQYKTSGALAAGINPVSLVTRKTASNSLWVTSNSTDIIRNTFKGHRR